MKSKTTKRRRRMSFSCRSRVLWRQGVCVCVSLGDVAAVAGVLGALRAVFPIARFPLEGGGHADGVEELGELPGHEVAAISAGGFEGEGDDARALGGGLVADVEPEPLDAGVGYRVALGNGVENALDGLQGVVVHLGRARGSGGEQS